MDFHLEGERRKSFVNWADHFPVDPIRLAKAGFYYTGKDDEVVCFSCQGHIKNWNYGDIVQKKHAELFPFCDFVNNKSNNIPMSKAVSNDTNIIANNFYNNTQNKINQTPLIKSDSNILNSSNDSKYHDLKDSPNHEKNKTVVDFDKMKSEEERLKTFKKWQLTSPNIKDLVQAGFFYLGEEDNVQCPYCQGIICNWEAGDVPLQEHIKHFPWCDYLSNHGYSKKSKQWYKISSQDICGNNKLNDVKELPPSPSRLLNKSHSQMTLQTLGIQIHENPKNPQQASLAARQRSFAKWPETNKVTKEALADAGFFYIGIRDHTKCFYCDGGLHNWEDGDDPWIEHARWFPECGFLHMNKGNDFIASYSNKSSYKMDVGCNNLLHDSSISPPKSLMNKVDEAMESNFVKYALETDIFPYYLIRAAVLRQIKESGASFENMEELCLAASYLKEEMTKDILKGDEDCLIKSINFVPQDESNSSSDQVSVKMEPIEAKILSNSPLPNLTNKEEENSQQESLKDQCLCKICMDREVGVVFLPCGHLLTCTLCSPALKECPMCRKAIKATVRAYLL